MNNEEKRIAPKLRFTEFKNTSVWETKPLGKAADFLNGRAYKKNELLKKGKYRVLRVGNFFTNNEWYYSDLELDENKYCDYGDLLYAWSASFGPYIWEEEKVIYHYHIWKVLNKQNIDRIFLYYLLDFETFRMKSESLNGFALKHLTKGTIESWTSFIPKNPKEQEKIANCLSSLDNVIIAETKKLDLLKDHKKGLLQQLFPVEGETQPKYRFPEFENDGDWESTTIGEIGGFYYGKSAPKWSLSEDAPTLCVRYGELYTKFGAIIDKIYSRTNIDPKTLRFSKGGEILVPRVGEDPFAFSNCSYLPFPNIAIGEMISVYETDENAIFYTYYFNTLSNQFARVVEGQNVKNLYYVNLEPIKIGKPKSKEEQQKIANCFCSLDDVIETQEQKIENLKAHKKGLMQQLFPNVNELAL